MHDLNHNEDRPRGTYEFPFEFHHIDHTHPRYVMSYHWHVEYEIIRILEGSLTVTLDEKSFTAVKNDVIFVHSGILHSGIPHDCVYQCIVFDMNTFLKNNPVCGEYIQKILHQETMLFPHFSAEHLLKTRNNLEKILADNSGKTIKQVHKDAERDYWMSAQETLDYGFIDEIMANNKLN